MRSIFNPEKFCEKLFLGECETVLCYNSEHIQKYKSMIANMLYRIIIQTNIICSPTYSPYPKLCLQSPQFCGASGNIKG